jgi:3-oxoacyl-[acyl-carrier-protein] synthase-3
MSNPFILGTGSFLPEKTVTNVDLEKMVDTSDEWITTRTGIKARRIAGPGEETSALAAKAALKAMNMAEIPPKELDLIIVGTITSDMSMPSCACLVQEKIGAANAYAFDINAACCGYLYSLDCADSYVRRNPKMKILVVGAETLSSRVNWQDRNTCVLFGDGAGACVVGGPLTNNSGVIYSKLRSDGSLAHLLSMDSAKGMNPDLNNANNTDSCIQMAGRDVFKFAVRAMGEAAQDVLEHEELSLEDIKLVIPHQANIRILKSLSERLAIPEEKLYVNIDKYGNTSAATIAIALDEANRAGRLERGDLILFCAFGGGFTWGASIVRW